MPTLPPDVRAGWQEVAPGVAWRAFRFTQEDGQTIAGEAVRLNTNVVTLRVHYAPGAPRSISAWAEATGANFLINASFFTEDFIATGLVVSDGEVSGQSFVGYGGMFQVSDTLVQVRSLQRDPYRPGEPIDQAVQTFPMLVLDGFAAYDQSGGRAARRSIVGMDRFNRLVFVVLPLPQMTLPEVSRWLAHSDFDLVTALNLDGGGSTGMYLEVGEARHITYAFDAVPVVIAAYLP